VRIGVIALQGGFSAHLVALRAAGFDAHEVRTPAEVDAADGLVLPGGESTVQLKLMERTGVGYALRRAAARRAPVLATCAGLILLAQKVLPAQWSFGLLDVTVARNAWGRQLDSFEAMDDARRLPLVFIRAPRIIDVGARVEVVATYRSEPILVRQGSIVGATFHPELTPIAAVQALAFGGAVAHRLPHEVGRVAGDRLDLRGA
jgi:5'-phosphate synthase pdxT subunit